MPSNFLRKHYKSKKLTTEEWVVVIIYLILSLFFYLGYRFNFPANFNWPKWMKLYGVGIPFIIIGAHYRNLRNLKYYVIWVTFSIMQLIVYQMAKNIPELNDVGGSALTGLRSLLPALVLYQLFRIFLLRINGRDLIVCLARGRTTRWEPEENRSISDIEIAFSILIAVTIMAFGFFWT